MAQQFIAFDPRYGELAHRFLRSFQSMRTVHFPTLPNEIITDTSVWIFPALDFIKRETDDDLTADLGTVNDNWEQRYQAGMPKDLPPVDIFYAGRALHERYNKYAFHFRGVLSDPSNPAHGKAAWRLRLGGDSEVFLIHVWGIALYKRESRTSLIAHCNASDDAEYAKTVRVPRGTIRCDMVNIQQNDKESAHDLIERMSLLQSKQGALEAAADWTAKRRGKVYRDDVARISSMRAVRRMAERGIGFSKRALAKALGVDRKTVDAWFENIPSLEQELFDEYVRVKAESGQPNGG